MQTLADPGSGMIDNRGAALETLRRAEHGRSDRLLPTPRLSIVVGTHNRLDLLRRCVESVLADTQVSMALHVIDCGSTDGTQHYLTSLTDPRVVLHLEGERIGQAKSYNDVFRTIDTPYVAWLSDDNEAVNGGLDCGVGILDRHAEIGMVALKVRDVRGPFVQVPYIGGVSSIGVLNVNQGLLRTEVLREVGYFSETFGFYGIDPDLTAMVLFSGQDIVYTKAVALLHHRTWLSDEESPEFAADKRARERSLDLYQLKYVAFAGVDRNWERKKRLWKKLSQRLAKWRDPLSPVPLLGGTYKDWKNVFAARYISLFDPVVSTSQDFHLRQHVPRRKLPAKLPSDPILEIDGNAAGETGSRVVAE